MKVRVFSEELDKGGIEADWPAIPRIGEFVCFHHRGGGSTLKVEDIRWQVDTDGNPLEVEIHLTF